MFTAFSRIRDGLILSLFVLAAVAYSDDASASSSSLTNELEQVRAALAETREAISEAAKKVYNKQHDIEYDDPVCAALHKEIKALEKEMIEKRQALEARLEVVPEYIDLLHARKDLFRRLEALQAEEEAILREMRTAEYQADASEE
ncbi:MAG: hypothetical protein KJ626_13260 [Verrucomicrobia bacterium]|nr:hypothetical protein [Verrucomicrobiota bacterium]